MDKAKSDVLDAALDRRQEALEGGSDSEARLTLAYTSRLHRAWRPILSVMPVYPAWRILDVATGYGMLPMELAALLPVRVHGIDLIQEYIDGARAIASDLTVNTPGFFHPGSQLAFEVGDAMDLPCEDATYELAIVRELLQFLPDPIGALRELHRTLIPGGYACVGDVDDQLFLTWPPPSEAFQRLHAAIASVQVQRGGDRHTGRKLTAYLRSAGFDVLNVVILSEAQHHVVSLEEPERALVLEQFAGARQRVMDAGMMSAAAYDRDVAAVAGEESHEQFRTHARVVALAQKGSS